MYSSAGSLAAQEVIGRILASTLIPAYGLSPENLTRCDPIHWRHRFAGFRRLRAAPMPLTLTFYSAFQLFRIVCFSRSTYSLLPSLLQFFDSTTGTTRHQADFANDMLFHYRRLVFWANGTAARALLPSTTTVSKDIRLGLLFARLARRYGKRLLAATATHHLPPRLAATFSATAAFE